MKHPTHQPKDTLSPQRTWSFKHRNTLPHFINHEDFVSTKTIQHSQPCLSLSCWSYNYLTSLLRNSSGQIYKRFAGRGKKKVLGLNAVYPHLPWLQWKDANWSGTGTSHDHLDWPRLSYREQFKEGDEEADRWNDVKTTSKSGLALNGISHNGKLRTTRSLWSWL